MRRRVILTDDDDHPAAVDLVSSAHVVAGVITAPAVADLLLSPEHAPPGIAAASLAVVHCI
jgi:hypothetical protein